jgi:hypothetical protein
MAQKKKLLVAAGKLDKFGRPNEGTPQEYLRALNGEDLQTPAAGSELAGQEEPAIKEERGDVVSVLHLHHRCMTLTSCGPSHSMELVAVRGEEEEEEEEAEVGKLKVLRQHVLVIFCTWRRPLRMLCC